MIIKYSYGQFVADLIGRGLRQSPRDCEVIVFNDGSGDSSPRRREVKAGSFSAEMRGYLTVWSFAEKSEAIARIAYSAARRNLDLQRSVSS